MKSRPRGGLGRGLGALIPTADTLTIATAAAGQPADGLAPVPGVRLAELPLSSITPNPRQPRQTFDEEALAELTASIREVGVLQPVVVREIAVDKYELVMGERRWRAAQAAGRETIPALVRDTRDDAMLRDALLENIHRVDLNPLEEAAAYQQLMEDFNLTQEQVAQKVGKSRSAVANTLRLFQLPPSIQRLVAENQLSAGHARALLGTPDRAFQEDLARKIVDRGLSVREAEEAVRAHQEALTAAESDGASDQVATAVAHPAARRLRPPGLLELEELLADHLDTRVKVSMAGTNGRGKVVVEFAGLEDLERIYRVMTEGKPRD